MVDKAAMQQFVLSQYQRQYRNLPEWDLTKPLPKLSVPDLGMTMTRYLASVRSIMNDEEYAETKAVVRNFENGEGQKLQRKLIDYATSMDDCWARKFWLDDFYFNIKLPLPVNICPGWVFELEKFPTKNHQLWYAARLVTGLLDVREMISNNTYPVDRVRHHEPGQPLCMDQYRNLFTTYRVPGGSDPDHHIVTKASSSSGESHIIVAIDNQFYKMEVTNATARMNTDAVYHQLQSVIKAHTYNHSAYRQPPVGVMTTEARDWWGDARVRLLKTGNNRLLLETIENSLMLVCLDKSVPTENSDILSTRLKHMICGFNVEYNSCNRWYDKTLQLIVSDSGSCGLCYEHSVAEGIAVINLFELVLVYMKQFTNHGPPADSHPEGSKVPELLNWTITDEIKDDIQHAKNNMQNLADRLDIRIYTFTHFGRNFPKQHNCSPDSFLQLALQLAFYRIHNCSVATYESAAIRRFHRGRVDNIRANSAAAIEWTYAMSDSDVDPTTRRKLFNTALDYQIDMMLKSIIGCGMDNHLVGLKAMATMQGLPKPELFDHFSYEKFNHWSLSTSQVPTVTDSAMGYGAVVENGYGVSYNPKPEKIVFCISSFTSCDETDTDAFVRELERALLDMRSMCEENERILNGTS